MTLINNIITGLFWIIVGAATALIYLLSQQWSVHLLNPQRTRWSIRLIIGGTILRWLLIIAVFLIAAAYTYEALFIVFITFMTVRLIFLLKWQGWLRIKNTIIDQL